MSQYAVAYKYVVTACLFEIGYPRGCHLMQTLTHACKWLHFAHTIWGGGTSADARTTRKWLTSSIWLLASSKELFMRRRKGSIYNQKTQNSTEKSTVRIALEQTECATHTAKVLLEDQQCCGDRWVSIMHRTNHPLTFRPFLICYF